MYAIGSQMKQLFNNIIGNAIKFRKPDMLPVIDIRTHVLTEEEKIHHDLVKDTTYYQVAITDNGIGFEEEYNTRIFQVFQRLHGKSEYPGSGIGLAICKKIVEYHHGVIYAENIPGVGARFVFILPQHQKSS
jgi:signal transduction histidine kinase